MASRFALFLGLAFGAVALSESPVSAQPAALPVPKFEFGHDLKVRKGKETDWEKASKIGVEVFKDNAVPSVIAISATGNLAVAGDEASPNKKSEWATGLSFSVRTADEEKFTGTTSLFGVEVFKGALTGQLLFISERGGIAFYPAAGAGSEKDPAFQYGLKLKARKPAEEKFTDAKAFGIDAYRDNNTGCMVYICETGMIATAKAIPDKVPDAKDVKKPTPLHGLIARVRKSDEADFTDKTQKFGIEVFRDENTGTLIYISETGSIQAVPAPAEIKTGQKLSWTHACALKVRAGGESDFAKAKKYGVEVFIDRHTGYVVYVSETGAIAVLPKK